MKSEKEVENRLEFVVNKFNDKVMELEARGEYSQ